MPEITVGITTHNLEKYIRTCIEELIHQTYQSFDILVYDDCSTDQTREILKELQMEYAEHIQLIFGQEPLKSPARARNALLDSGMIQGKYLVFLDGDDSIEQDFLEKLHMAAEKSQAEITLCAYDRFEEETGHVLCQEMRGFPEVIQLPDQKGILAFVNTSLWNKLILVESIGVVRFPDFKVGEDLSFLFALYEKCTSIACVDNILIHYRVRRSSVISNMEEETVYQFAEELLRLHSGASDAWFRDTLELAIFIHIGISMPLRMYGNKKNDISALLSWLYAYFQDHFHWFRGKRLLRFPSLVRYGFKGVGLWGAKSCYCARCFPLFLWLYQTVTKVLHIDIKF